MGLGHHSSCQACPDTQILYEFCKPCRRRSRRECAADGCGRGAAARDARLGPAASQPRRTLPSENRKNCTIVCNGRRLQNEEEHVFSASWDASPVWQASSTCGRASSSASSWCPGANPGLGVMNVTAELATQLRRKPIAAIPFTSCIQCAFKPGTCCGGSGPGPRGGRSNHAAGIRCRAAAAGHVPCAGAVAAAAGATARRL